MIKKFFFTATMALFLVVACKKKADTNTPEMQQLTSEFRAFYENFHADSLYQFRHVAFPLKGFPVNADSITLASGYFHQPEQWVMHHAVDFSKGEFIQSIVPITESMVVEHILKADNSFGIERRFAKLSDGEWNLIFYAAPNRFSIRQK